MLMSGIWILFLFLSIICAAMEGRSPELSAAALKGAQSGIELSIAIAGSICLWSGVGVMMERGGLTKAMAHLLRPFLRLLFPSTRSDPLLATELSGNICANILGLGNAATPMGIRATRRMLRKPGVATDEMCRLIVLNTASIQLIPGNVTAIRAELGASAPFEILPAVWITSLCSASLGLIAAWLLGRFWHHD